MALVENFEAYLYDFGVVVVLNSVSIRGIFDNGYADAFDMAGTAPSILVKSSDAITAVRGTTAAIAATNYIVAGPPEVDGTGMTKLKLEKV